MNAQKAALHLHCSAVFVCNQISFSSFWQWLETKHDLNWIRKKLKKKSYFCQAEIISSNVFPGLVYFYWSSGYCWHYICNHVSAKGTPAVSNGSRRCLCRYVSFQYLCSSVIQDLNIFWGKILFRPDPMFSKSKNNLGHPVEHSAELYFWFLFLNIFVKLQKIEQMYTQDRALHNLLDLGHWMNINLEIPHHHFSPSNRLQKWLINLKVKKIF